MKDKLQILCYHGFETFDESSFRPKLFMKEVTFNSRLALIAKYNFPVLPLDSALTKLRNKQLPGNTIVITIDDGFYNVLNVAASTLDTYKYPVTLYLTTYYVVKGTPIFRLVIQYMFWKTTVKRVDFRNCIWSENTELIADISTSHERQKIMWDCINYGESICTEPERVKICEQLGTLLEVNYLKICDNRILSLLTIDEAKLLTKNNFNIQLHTHRHIFPTDNELAAKKEITENREILEKIVDYPTNHFCYPSGIWDKAQWSWLEQKNVKSATTCLPGLNSSEFQAYGLNRFLDGENISQIEFMAEIFGFMELLRALKMKIKTLIK